MRPSPCMLLALALSLAACSKDSPVGPGTGGSTPPGVTTVIGPGGGTITMTDFLLTIPPGTFAAQETLTVSVDQGSSEFGTRALSSAFKLQGLPAQSAHPLHVRFKCQRTPSTGTFVAVGREGVTLSDHAAGLTYQPLPAKDSSGYLIADIPAQGTGSQLKVPGRSGFNLARRTAGTLESVKWLIAIDQQDTLVTPGKHFRIFYPKYLEGKAATLGGCLEEAYTVYDQLGLGASTYEFTDWPIPVSVSRFKATPAGLLGYFLLMARGKPDYPLWGLLFNEEMIGSASEAMIRKTAAHLFSFGFCTRMDQFFWDLHTDQENAKEDNRIWPYNAIASWAEEKFIPASEQPLFVPENFPGRELRPLQGMTCPSNESSLLHGAAMSGLIKYIASTYGESLVPALYRNVSSSAYAPDALITTIPDGPDVWWPGFLKAYISGDIYRVATDTLLKKFTTSPAADQFTIGVPSDTAKHFSASYPDLSARLYKINLRYPEINAGSWLQFVLDPVGLNLKYVGIMLFGLKDKKLEYWGYGSEVKLERIKDLTSAGYDVVAAVINGMNAPPYNDSRAIDLTVRVNGSTNGVPLQASITEKIYGTFTDRNLLTTYGNVSYFAPYSAMRNGVLSGHTFTASWNGPWSGTGPKTAKGSLVLTFDNSSPPHVIGFALQDTVVGEGYTYVWSMTSGSGCDIPGTLDYRVYVFLVSNEDIRFHLGTLAYREEQENGYWKQLVSANPRYGDLISIAIDKW